MKLYKWKTMQTNTESNCTILFKTNERPFIFDQKWKKSYNKNESNILTFDMPYLNARILVYVLTKQTIEDRSWTCMPWDISDCPK